MDFITENFSLILLAGVGVYLAWRWLVNRQPVDLATLDVEQLPDDINVQTAAALRDHERVFLLDVREPSEYAQGHIPGIKHIPLGSVAKRIKEIPADKVVVVTCRSGNRSGQAAGILRQKGRKQVHNMRGGIMAWQMAGLPVEK